MHNAIQVFEESFHRCLAASQSVFDVRDSENINFFSDSNFDQQIRSVERLLENQKLFSPQSTSQTKFLVLQANKCRRYFERYFYSGGYIYTY